MSTDSLFTAAMGNDCEHHILTGGDERLLAAQRQDIVRSCAMPYTEAMPVDEVRWRFPRYCLPGGGGAFYFDVCRESDILEHQTPECANPYQLAAAQTRNREFMCDRLGQRIRLGAAGYVRGRRRRTTYSGSHLNVSINDPSLPGLRTALRGDAARQAMLFFLATCQVWGGIGTHLYPEWEVRSRAIAADLSNDCISFKGLLQPGRDVPALEVKEIETLHYTHYEAGWSRSAYQRALSAATTAMDAHLGCHHTSAVLQTLHAHGLRPHEDQPWHTLRLDLSRCFGPLVHDPVKIGDREWTLLDLLGLRLALYDQLLTDREKADLPWVNWALTQLQALREALGRYPAELSGPLLGLDSIVKYELIFRPTCEQAGYDFPSLCQMAEEFERGDADQERLPFMEEVFALHNQLFGLNLLYHDFSIRGGLYEQVLADVPEVARRQRVAQVDEALQAPLPPTRSARRQRLMDAYAAISARSNGALAPCFAGFDRIGIKVRTNGDEHVHMHHLGSVLDPHVTREDWLLVQRYANMVGVSAEQA